MSSEERKIILKDCNRRLQEIKRQKLLVQEEWENHYNEKYKKRFAIEQTLNNIASSSITGLVVFGSAVALSAIGNSKAISFGVPVGVYAAVGISALGAMLANIKKKREHWDELVAHSSIQSHYDEESNLYKLISTYIINGDTYLLQLYRESLESKSNDENADEFGYLDFDTTNLSPLMSKTIEEIRERSLQLRNNLRDEILKDICFMQLQIASSTVISIPELEEVQKMLKQHVPTTLEAQALTK